MTSVGEMDTSYAFDGVYEPGDVARYLAATLPWRAQPLTGRRVLRWIRGALVAPERDRVLDAAARGRRPAATDGDAVDAPPQTGDAAAARHRDRMQSLAARHRGPA